MEYEQGLWVDGACVSEGIFGPGQDEMVESIPEGTAPKAGKSKPEVAVGTEVSVPAVEESQEANLMDESAGIVGLSPTSNLSPQVMPAARVKRWGEGLDAPAAGVRNFLAQGFEVTLDVAEAIAAFGHNSDHVSKIMDAGRFKASTSPTPIASSHAGALFAY